MTRPDGPVPALLPRGHLDGAAHWISLGSRHRLGARSPDPRQESSRVASRSSWQSHSVWRGDLGPSGAQKSLSVLCAAHRLPALNRPSVLAVSFEGLLACTPELDALLIDGCSAPAPPSRQLCWEESRTSALPPQPRQQIIDRGPCVLRFSRTGSHRPCRRELGARLGVSGKLVCA
jgi:hypothetical protein